MSEMEASLNWVERAAVELGRFTNERPLPKRLQTMFLQGFTRTWVSPIVARRVYADGVDWVLEANPSRGVVFVSNHRSFFDMYIIMLVLFRQKPDWVQRIMFPVRANFFYEKPLGVAINMLIGGGCMYPPIFRDRERAALNKDAVDRVIAALDQRGNVVGLHPEGTRGKGPNPYELLPAQPGVGQIVLQAKPLVIPVFVNGLPNDLQQGVVDTYRPSARREHPVIAVFGEAFDYSEFTDKKPRAALYKKCADKMNQTIAALGERERELRAACARGEIRDDDGNWLSARARR